MKKITIAFIIIVIIIIGYLAYTRISGSGRETSLTAENQSSSDTKIYANDTYKFIFKYPIRLTPSSFTGPSGGDVIVLADDNVGGGIQILITPFDEDLNVLTADRIKRDQPDLPIIEPQDVILGNKGKGVAFLDGNGADAHRQVWFIANGYLYQITTDKASDTTLQAVLNSWEFQ